MQRLVDNTYLQSAGACLRGEAKNNQQVTTFLRFVGEIIAAEQMYFTGDKDGPVYPATKVATDEISQIFGSDNWLCYAPIDENNFFTVTYKAAEHLIDDIREFNPEHTLTSHDLFPRFHSESLDPNIELHRLLTQTNSSHMTARYGEPKSSNFAGFVLSREPVRQALDRRMDGKAITPYGCAILGIVIRMLAYDELARSIRSTYLPSTARAKMWILPRKTESRLLSLVPKSSLFEGSDKKFGQSDLPGVIDALIRVSQGSPREILQRAWLLRTETTKLRGLFNQIEMRGDAMLLYAEDMEREYRKVILQLIGEEAKPRIINSLLRTVTLTIGLPEGSGSLTPSIDDTPLRDWFKYKIRRNHVHALAILAKKTSMLKSETAYTRLFKLAMHGAR